MASTVVSAVVPVSLSAVLAVGSSATTESLPRLSASSFAIDASGPASVDFLFFDEETPVEL